MTHFQGVNPGCAREGQETLWGVGIEPIGKATEVKRRGAWALGSSSGDPQ